MRSEAMVALVLAAGGGTAVAVSSCGGSSKKSTSASTAASQPSTPTTTTTAAPAKPRSLAVRVNGRTTRLPISDLSFAYCRKSPAVCAAITSGQEKDLTPNQRRAVDAARQTIKDQQNAPAPLPSPGPAPPTGPEPQPAPEGTSTG
ncbi:MAG: hypothetical protein QOJ12_2794 [Thermoleophilales bacterium]|nr:hypothetical protein [Thermoleophilales bacterium]